ncbi:GL26882 [Drosophila persimilis]|uniref:GL26882 n=1 Tax=Drosophila persimilis TaxID=7234 RepID=B4H2Q7_DROPE|nr:GL26882 [Drosophila persimilis]
MSNYRYQNEAGGGERGYSGIEVRTFVSTCVKYMIFMLNFIFWLFGGLLLGIGIYAFKDKWEQANGGVRLETIYDWILNISLVMIITGIVIFVVSFAGCLGGKNEYFYCSSPSVERCGVPYSCCINATDISSGLVNIMCGYGVQEHTVVAASKLIWTSACIETVRVWAERNLYVIAGIALGIALIQLLVIYLAKTLEGQIELQKSRWAA